MKLILRLMSKLRTITAKPKVIKEVKREFLYDFKQEHLW